MIKYEDNVSEYRSEFIAVFGKERMSFHSLDSFNHYLNDFLTAFPSFSIKDDLQVFRVDIYKPLKPNQNA